MKRTLALLALLGLGLSNAFGQLMGQPGFFGRIELGNFPGQPPLMISHAVMGNPGVFTGSPIFMNVPPEHARNWSRFCQLYGACDWMVYFVDNAWYEQVYVPGWRAGMFYAPPVLASPPMVIAPPIILPPPPQQRPPHLRPPPPSVRPPPHRPVPPVWPPPH